MQTPQRMTVSTPNAYAAAYRTNQPVTIPSGAPLMGRLIRGRQEADFEWLAADQRPLVFCMGADGLEQLPGQPMRTALAAVGLTPEYVEGRLRQGYQYRLVVFAANPQNRLATWGNVLQQVSLVMPEAADDILRHSLKLATTPFSYFQAQIPEDIDQIELDGEANPLYMTAERYLAIPASERQSNAVYVRRLLANKFHLGPLFAGDGRTLTADGESGLEEFVIPNDRIANLAQARVLPVTL